MKTNHSTSAQAIQLRTAMLRPGALCPERQLRVLLLLAALVLFSAADLWMTLLHMRSGGMMEANAVVRLVATTGSPMVLVFWKLGCVAPFVLIMYSRRHRKAAELACLAACVLLGLVTWRWMGYSEVMMAHTGYMLDVQRESPYWVAMN